MKIERKEVYRYLGYRGGQPDDVMEKLVDECIDEVLSVADFKSVRKTFPLKLTNASDDLWIVEIGPLKAESKTLHRHLEGCDEAVIFAATAGIGIDRLIRRAELTQISKATVLQATGAAAVEAFCNEIDEQIGKDAAKEGKSARKRYSPGYGDFALSCQTELLSLLNASKETGIKLTDGDLMMPSKSVTAVIGLFK